MENKYVVNLQQAMENIVTYIEKEKQYAKDDIDFQPDSERKMRNLKASILLRLSADMFFASNDLDMYCNTGETLDSDIYQNLKNAQMAISEKVLLSIIFYQGIKK